MAEYVRQGLTGPAWLQCLSELDYATEIDEYNDDQLLFHSYRVEILNPPEDVYCNDRDWRVYRRLVRQEMHVRGLTTPTEPPEECW